MIYTSQLELINPVRLTVMVVLGGLKYWKGVDWRKNDGYLF
jgi:hypothetical protein